MFDTATEKQDNAEMKVYLVRHGESVGNVQLIHQTTESPLSDIGNTQAKLLAHRFKSIPYTKILSSPMTRAVQTAQHIADTSECTVEINELLAEYARPSVLFGHSIHSELTKDVNSKTNAHAADPNWHHSDEENNFDVCLRADKALDFLAQQAAESMVVVTHSGFIRMLLWRMLQPQQYDHVAFYNFVQHTRITNTGITVCEYKQKQAEWKVQTMNDDAHLG